MEAEDLFDQIGELIAQKKRSSMFGVPCYKVGRRPFMMFYDGQLVCKLFGQVHEEAMLLKGTSLFNPRANDKPMGNWVQFPSIHSDKWESFAKLAYSFVEME